MKSAKYFPIIEAINQVDQPVTIKGWVHTIRDMGKIAFIEVRDHTGIIQTVIDDPAKLPKLGLEYVVEVSGEIRQRGERYVNKNLATGEIELGAEEVKVLSQSEDMPFEIKKGTSDVNEELRLKYRYLDLRTERMAANIKLRSDVLRYIRNWLCSHGFVEVETPMLTKGTPEGAREFLVPSRLHPETFYVLPQSPQQFKQLLMVAGIGRYYQIARCLRDEDQRGDRQPEFTQVDMEMSFVDQEEVREVNEMLMKDLIKAVASHKKLSADPFPILTYTEAMEKYGTDKPDLRKNKKDDDELAFAWIVDFPMFEINNETSKVDAVHHPFTAPKPEDATDIAGGPTKARADAYDLVLNGYEVAGGSIRIHDRDLQHQVFELLGLGKQEIESRFGHMLEAFKYGVPPHGGIAWGFDRLIMILAGEPNIREVIAFPKTGDARDPLTGAPAPMPPERLKEAHIKAEPPKK
jgi:aspartyl-tRNA synthetase